jgi:hypothetical protein
LRQGPSQIHKRRHAARWIRRVARSSLHYSLIRLPSWPPITPRNNRCINSKNNQHPVLSQGTLYSIAKWVDQHKLHDWGRGVGAVSNRYCVITRILCRSTTRSFRSSTSIEHRPCYIFKGRPLA